jgi:PmbA protein
VTADHLELARDVTRKARARGADDCDCFIETGRELAIKVRAGRVETIERATSSGMGIRFFSRERLGFGYTTDLSAPAIEDLLDRCRAFAHAATADPSSGIPEPRPIEAGDLGIFDATIDHRPLAEKVGFAVACEEAALATDGRIRNTYATTYEEQRGRIIMARMNGDPMFYDATRFEAFCAPIAEVGAEKRMGIWASDARFFGDLDPAEVIGRVAAMRAVALLGARTAPTRKASVVFDPLTGCEVAGEIFRSLDGEKALRGMTFLKDKVGKTVGSELATFIDDGRMPRRLGTRPFDAEGIATRRLAAIDGGRLKSYFYDYRSAKKAGAAPSGNARRGFSSIPQVGENNFYLVPGGIPRDELISGVKEGLLVTRMLGFGVNLTTGDYSRGAEGLWIRNGEVDHPVDGVTVAGNLADMLMQIEGVASDLRFFGRMGSPTFVVREMTIAGE